MPVLETTGRRPKAWLAVCVPGWCLFAMAGCGPEPVVHANGRTTGNLVITEAADVSTVSNVETQPDSDDSQGDGTVIALKPATDRPLASGEFAPPVPMRDWEFIVLHHTATNVGDVDAIDREHRRRKDSSGNPWRGIGYHFLIGNGKGMPDGKVEPTFRWQEQSDGAHAGSLKHNVRGVGICLVGNFNETAPTRKQMASLKRLMKWLHEECGIPESRVLRHSELKTTDCPGRRFTLK